jgi:hypothetical protein
MSEKIEPALSAEEWEAIASPENVSGCFDLDYDARIEDDADIRYEERHKNLTGAAIIAVMNNRLSDDDPRKMDLSWVLAIRSCAMDVEAAYENPGPSYQNPEARERLTLLNQIAEALESYLPPETP